MDCRQSFNSRANIMVRGRKGYELCIKAYEICNRAVKPWSEKDLGRLFFTEFRGGCPIGFPKTFCEVGVVVKADLIANFGDVDITFL